MANSSLNSLFGYNAITNPAGGINANNKNLSALAGKISLNPNGNVVTPSQSNTSTVSSYNPALPTPALNQNTQSSLSQLSLPSVSATGISSSNKNLAGIGGGINPSGQYSTIAPAHSVYTTPPATAPTGASGATGATGSTLSSIYSGATGATGGTTLSADQFDQDYGSTGASGATGATGSAFPQSYYNADGTLMTPQQVAANIGNSLAAAHTSNSDIGTLAAQQFSNPDGGTTADAQAQASQINNTKNDISTGATDPYNVLGNGIAYTPEELDAIQKAYAGIYTPALNTALAKVTLKQTEDKAALDQQNALAQIDEQAKATVAAQANAPYTLGADEIRYDASGNPIAAGPESYQNALLNGNAGASALAQYTRTAVNGTPYVDLSTVTDPTENAALQNAARAAGIMPVTPDQATKLQNIADVSSSLDQIQSQFSNIGAKNGVEEVAGGFGLLNNLTAPFRPDVASYQAWRTAAINSIQALAGGSGSGVRINQAEINSAMQNDIPNLGDTVGTANAKIQVLKTQLNNWENELLNTNTSATGASGSSGSTPITTPDGKQWVQNADGSYTSFNGVGNTTASTLQKAPEGNYSFDTLNRPQRNNNPGDLKPGGIADRYANGVTAQGDLTFASPAVGFNALKADVTAKINGDSSHLPANPTIAQLGTVYAQDPNWGAKVAAILKVPASTPTQSIPINQLIQAIATQEGFFA